MKKDMYNYYEHEIWSADTKLMFIILITIGTSSGIL